jgi:hypothetical protein
MSATTGIAISTRPHKSPLFSNEQIEQIAKGNSGSIAKWVHSTARQQGVAVRLRPSDRFARTVSRLSDGIVDLDHIEELLVALRRAGVITPFQRGLLQLRYLR